MKKKQLRNFVLKNTGKLLKQKRNLFLILFVPALILSSLLFGKGPVIWIKNQSAALTIKEQGLLGMENSSEFSPLNGEVCRNYQSRAWAVVLAGDNVARPLSGLSQADLVFEMPVITGAITRMLAVYLCDRPSEIGPMRSARHDFIPLAMGLDAILVHWGGSHFALDKLNQGIMDNIDALINPYNAFYRKNWLRPPHNGFTSMERLLVSASKLDYRLEGQFAGYSFQDENSNYEHKTDKKLIISYSYPYNVEYHYEAETNSYLRWRGGRKEIDGGNDQQIKAKNIVVMRAYSRQIEGQYNDLAIEGEGKCQVYQNGEIIDCIWNKDKDDPKSKLYFLNRNTEEEISFVPGQIWIEIVEPNQEISWQ